MTPSRRLKIVRRLRASADRAQALDEALAARKAARLAHRSAAAKRGAETRRHRVRDDRLCMEMIPF